MEMKNKQGIATETFNDIYVATSMLSNISNLTSNSTSIRLNESYIPSLIQFLFGFIGNTLSLIILISTSRKHKWKPFYRLVLAMTLADYTVAVLVYPIVFKRYASGFSYSLTDYECHHISFVDSFSFLCSALLVTSLSIDRFIAVVFPHNYKTREYLRTHALILTSWILAATICALPLVGIGHVNRIYPGTWCFIDFTSHETANVVDTYIYAGLGIVIFVTTVILNITVVIILIKRVVLIKAKFGKQKTLRNDIYVILFVLTIVIVFSVLWTPLSAHMIQNINSDNPGNGDKEFLVGRLAITNQMVDPWIYIVLRKENFEFLERLYKRSHTTRKETRNSDPDSTTMDELK